MFDQRTARRIRLVGLDVDGVMTDAGVYVGMAGSERVELKRFDIQDGVGIKLLMDCDVRVAIVSGRASRATDQRAEELGITDVVQDDKAMKLPAFERLLDKYELSWEECAFVGDDLPDLPIMTRVGLPVAVRNAVSEVRAAAHYITEAGGGRGAIREFIEVFLKAREEWDDVVERYLLARGETVWVANV